MALKEWEFTNWNVQEAVQQALNDVDEAIASARVLQNQIRRKALECLQADELLEEEIPAASRTFGSMKEELGVPMVEAPGAEG